MISEIEHVNRMRNAVAYGQSKNSIIEWMNSPEWTAPYESASGKRGRIVTQYDVYWNNEISGEIEVKTMGPDFVWLSGAL